MIRHLFNTSIDKFGRKRVWLTGVKFVRWNGAYREILASGMAYHKLINIIFQNNVL